MLVSEDPGGVPLDRLLGRPLELIEALRLAIGVAAGVRRLHERGFIHKDLKPANILVEPASGKAWLMGFGIASHLPREGQPSDIPEVFAGTLAYMSPEQTGRMNRSIDSRSDLYSFGVSLYEMLTGLLPFSASSMPGSRGQHSTTLHHPRSGPGFERRSPPTTSRSRPGQRIAPRILEIVRRWPPPRSPASKAVSWTPSACMSRPSDRRAKAASLRTRALRTNLLRSSILPAAMRRAHPRIFETPATATSVGVRSARCGS